MVSKKKKSITCVRVRYANKYTHAEQPGIISKLEIP